MAVPEVGSGGRHGFHLFILHEFIHFIKGILNFPCGPGNVLDLGYMSVTYITESGPTFLFQADSAVVEEADSQQDAHGAGCKWDEIREGGRELVSIGCSGKASPEGSIGAETCRR